MTNDTDAPIGVKRVSDPVFFGLVVLMTLLIVAGGIYFLNRGGSSSAAPLAPLAPTSGPSQSPVPSSPGAQHAGPTKARALAVVERYFQLGQDGRFRASCALESPAYLKFDSEHYAHGSCAAESRAVAKTLASQGLSMHLIGNKIVTYADGKATILAEVTVGTRVVTQHIYVRYHDGKWWLTGGDDSGGDLGF